MILRKTRSIVKKRCIAFPAKKESLCPKCRTLITLGSYIRRQGIDWVHLLCPPKKRVRTARKGKDQVRLETALNYWEREYARCGRRN